MYNYIVKISDLVIVQYSKKTVTVSKCRRYRLMTTVCCIFIEMSKVSVMSRKKFSLISDE